MSTLDEGLTDLCEEIRFNAAVERGEIEVVKPAAHPGVYRVDEHGNMIYVGTDEQVTEDLTAAFAQAVIDADNTDYYDEDA